MVKICNTCNHPVILNNFEMKLARKCYRAHSHDPFKYGYKAVRAKRVAQSSCSLDRITLNNLNTTSSFTTSLERV